MRYFSLLYAAAERREAVLALYVIDAEIRESAQSANHDVAHTRLQWWRAEVDRLVNGNAQHPATQVLQDLPIERRVFRNLHEALAAADMDLAHMTYNNWHELRAYSSRSGGAIQELVATVLDDSYDETIRKIANRIGIGIRQAEIMRDLGQDARAGRLYLPLDELQRLGLRPEALRERVVDPAARQALQSLHATTIAELRWPEELDPQRRARLRPLWVLAELHRRLMDRIAAQDYDVAGTRMELGPIEKPWVAWRAARRSA